MKKNNTLTKTKIEYFKLLDSYNSKENLYAPAIDAQLANFSTLTADNGDDKYGVVEDYVTLLDCDQYRRYRKLMPKYDDWVWTLTPRSCTVGDAFSVRNIIPSGELDSYFADNTYGVAPACLFNLNYLSLCRQARIITHK